MLDLEAETLKILEGYYDLPASDIGLLGGEIMLTGENNTPTYSIYNEYGIVDPVVCAIAPTPVCNEGDKVFVDCSDGSTVATQICVNDQWEDTGASCPAENGGGGMLCGLLFLGLLATFTVIIVSKRK